MRPSNRLGTLAAVVGLPLACEPMVLAQGGLRDPFPVALQLADLDGEIGFRINGVTSDTFSGSAVASAGDVNGDGLDDFIIGATGARDSSTDPGSCYVFFGRDSSSGTPFPSAMELDELDGTNGFRLDGVIAGDYTGQRIDSAGDVNGDGIDDLIIGAPRADPGGLTNAGSSFVVFGRDGASGATFPAVMQLADLDGENGFRVDGAGENDNSGSAVAAAGDVNADGIDDLIIGAFDADPDGRTDAGSSYVIYGRDVSSGTPFPATLSLASIDGTNGFRLDGVSEGDYSGRSVAFAGDVNGDGLDDLIIGATGVGADSRGNLGMSYVVFGRDSTLGEVFPAVFELADIDGTNGFGALGVDISDESGDQVATAGDINGDGIDDVIIGAYKAEFASFYTDAGSSFVVFGRDTTSGATFPPVLRLEDLDGVTGLRIDGVAFQDASGCSVAAAGDVDGDGIDDLIIGARTADPAGRFRAGASYVVYGRDVASGDTFPARLRLFDLDGVNGFRLGGAEDGDRSGFSVDSAGDVNGDGMPDLIIGAPIARVGGVLNSGSSFIVFGRDVGSCDADIDGDGRLTLFDFLEFQNLFDAGDPIADFDGDGRLTLFDFLAFQNAFDAGCP
ncbi:MAG: GC-type dockerin domain-anchored protein [Phycisphaerales bacterium]